jgi:hypothetical protein
MKIWNSLVLACLLLFVLEIPVQAQVCETKKLHNEAAVTSLSKQELRTLKLVRNNLLRFSEPQGSGFIFAPFDREQSLILTASHVARMQAQFNKKTSRQYIGFPALENGSVAQSDQEVTFSLEDSLETLSGERIFTPTLELMENWSTDDAYRSLAKNPVLDFTIISSSTTKLKEVAENEGLPAFTSLKWAEPKLGQKVMVISQETISTGCVDNVKHDLSFQMTANVDDGMSGGMVVDIETGAVVGILTVGYSKADGTDFGSGGVSMPSILNTLKSSHRHKTFEGYAKWPSLYQKLLDSKLSE